MGSRARAGAIALLAVIAPTASAAGVDGIVVDGDGRPLAGARVALVPMGLFDPSGARYVRADSAADGRFHLADGGHVELGVDLASGRVRYAVTATAPGYTAAWAPDRGGRLQLGRGGRRLSGRVLDRQGRPRAGVEVRVARGFGEDGAVFLVDSAADGRWSVLVPDGDYHVDAVDADFAAAQQALPRGRDAIDLVLDPIGRAGAAPPAVVGWLRDRALPLATVVAGHDLADLRGLRAIIGNARVVGLGEATHGTREIFQLKHRLFTYLVGRMGFTVFAIEISLAESLAIEDYLRGGAGDAAQLLAGQFVAVWQTEELRDLTRWMREWNRTHARKVHFCGLDMRIGVRAAKDTLAYLARVDGATPPALLAALVDPVDSPALVRQPAASLVAAAQALVAQLERQRDAYVARSSAESWWRATMEARALAQWLEWHAAPDLTGRVHVRERAMAENALRMIEHYQARAVVWAHNAHVAADRELEPHMMGWHLRSRLGAAYRPFGSVLDHGAYQAIDGASGLLRTFAVAPGAPGSLESTLVAAGPPLAIFDMRDSPETGVVAEWLRAFHPMHQYDGLYDDPPRQLWGNPSVIVPRLYDALFFAATGTAARPLPFAREQFTEKPVPPATTFNLDFEEPRDARDEKAAPNGEDVAPRGWERSPVRDAVCGYAVARDRQQPFAGLASGRIARTRAPRAGECPGRLRQIIDASRFRGKRVRVRAAVRVERAGEHAHPYIEAGGHRASERATGAGWHSYAIVVEVPPDARTLEFGLAFDGEGRAWLDAVSLTTP